MATFEQILLELFEIFWNKVLRIVIKTVNIQVNVVVIHLHCFQVVQNLFGKVSILLQKAPNLGRFKKNLEKKEKFLWLLIILSFVFF